MGGGGGECGPWVGIWQRNPSPQWEVWSSTFARGSGRLLVFGKETGTKFQPVYIESSIFVGKGVEFGVKCSTITLKCKFVCIVTFCTATMMKITHNIVSLGRLVKSGLWDEPRVGIFNYIWWTYPSPPSGNWPNFYFLIKSPRIARTPSPRGLHW